MAEKSTDKNLKVYLSGPMTGLPDFNYPAFLAAAQDLRTLDYEVFNPAEQFGGDQTKPFSEYMREDVKALLDANLVYVLDGWQNSVGAIIEVLIALSLNLPILDMDHNAVFDRTDHRQSMKLLLGLYEEVSEPQSVLQEAHGLVHGDRQGSYGHPYDDFAKTAKIWTGVLLDKLKPGVEIERTDVPLCMVGVKLSREVNQPKRDNRVDGAGYFETLELVHIRQNEILAQQK